MHILAVAISHTDGIWILRECQWPLSRYSVTVARMSRADRQAITRREILDAARVRFLRDGYRATSLEQIADDAGYSKGAVYSNFQNRANLCRVVLQGVQQEKLAEVAIIVARSDGVSDLQHGLEKWMSDTIGDVGWTMLEMELSLDSRGDRRVAEMIMTMHTGMRDTMVSVIQQAADHLGLGAISDEQARELAGMLTATTFGLGVQRAVNPSVSIEPGMAVIRTILATFVGAD